MEAQKVIDAAMSCGINYFDTAYSYQNGDSERFLDIYDQFDVAMIQLNYLDWTLLNAKRQYEILTEHEISVWVMEPMKGGRLSTLNEKAASILKSASPERSVSSWGFRFLQGLPNVQTVLSGMSSVEQVMDNAKTFEKI